MHPIEMNFLPKMNNIDINNVIDCEENFKKAAQSYFNSLNLKVKPLRDDEKMLRSKKEIDDVLNTINNEKKSSKLLKSVERKRKIQNQVQSKKRRNTGENRVDLDNFVGNDDFEDFKRGKNHNNVSVKKDEIKSYSIKKYKNDGNRNNKDRKKNANFKRPGFQNKGKGGFSSEYGKKKSKNRPGKGRRAEMRESSKRRK